MAGVGALRTWIQCACLVALDVAPLWYKSHRSFYFWSASGSLIITGTLSSKYGLDGEYRNEWIASLSFSLLLTFRRYASSWTRRQWVKLISSHVKSERQSKSFLSPPKSLMDLVEIVEDGGPLGPGVGKLWDACVGTLFFRLVSPHFRDFSSWTEYCSIGPLWPNWWLPLCVVILSMGVNVVLWIWSTCLKNSRGAHEGVHRMVKGTINRRLSTREHAVLVAWSLTNAICEEVSSRGFNRWEFSALWGNHGPTNSRVFDPSNLWQATTFGLAHFYGVPSGWTGVGLTFVYGWIMGFLQDIGGGLLYPILTHTMADYFIFSQIARRQ